MSDHDLFGEAERKAAVRRKVRAIKISAPLPDPRLRILNLGGGVQSCALALMSARGELEPLDCAIFADTGWEKMRTYRYLDWLEQQVPFPILRVKRAGLDLGQYLIEGATLPQEGRQHAPFYVSDPDTMLSKQCSKEFKTRVIHAALRELLGLGYGERGPAEPVVEQWLGMTNDELGRVSVSEKKYLHHRYPLIERRMTKADLYPWYEQRQLPVPPKSSCIFCPLQRPDQFRDLMATPEDRDRLVPFDEAIPPGHAGMSGRAYLVRQRVPIADADLRSAEDLGQVTFEDFCGDGNCGV